MAKKKKKRSSVLGAIVSGAKNVAKAAAESKKERSQKYSKQRQDCGAPC